MKTSLRKLATSSGVALAIALPLVTHADYVGYGPGMMMGGYGYGAYGLGGLVTTLLIWGLLIVGIVAVVKHLRRTDGDPSATANAALNILKERYARGEIDKEEFETKKKDVV